MLLCESVAGKQSQGRKSDWAVWTRGKLSGMTPVHAIASVALAVLVYACVAFWRFSPIEMEAFNGYVPAPEKRDVRGTVVGVVLLIGWGATIFILGHLGHDGLQAVVWAAAPCALLLFATVRYFLPERCPVCSTEVRRFRKRHPPETPAIVHLKICDHCKTYREELAIGSGG